MAGGGGLLHRLMLELLQAADDAREVVAAVLGVLPPRLRARARRRARCGRLWERRTE